MDQQVSSAGPVSAETPIAAGPVTGREASDEDAKRNYVQPVRQWFGSIVDFGSILLPFALIDLLPFPLSIIGFPLAAVGPVLVPGLMLHRYGFNPGMWLTGGRLLRMHHDGRVERVGAIRGTTRYYLELITLLVVVAVGITVPFSTIILLWICRRVHPADRILGTRVLRRGVVPAAVAHEFIHGRHVAAVPV